MMMKSLLRTCTWAITATISLSACAAMNEDASKTLKVTEIYSSSLCNINEQGIAQVKDKAAFQKILNKANNQ